MGKIFKKSKYQMGCIIDIVSSQAVEVRRMPCQVKALHPFLASDTLKEHLTDSTSKRELTVIFDAPSESSDVDSLNSDPNLSDYTRKDSPMKVMEPALLCQSTWIKKPAPVCCLCDEETSGEWSGNERLPLHWKKIKRQNNLSMQRLHTCLACKKARKENGCLLSLNI